MTATAEAPRASAPWHYWVVTVVALVWNAFGAYDYFMTKTQGDAYLRKAAMTDAQIAHVHAYPVWMTADWAIGVWGALLGALLLVARTRYAVHVFVVSLAAFVVMLVYTYLLSDGAKAMGQQGMIVNLAILAGCIFFAWYSWTMAKRGVLK
ncbi:hypothetical protein [Phenylobacterium sp.]|uniref:hypothetical protein n=1 Tax=Phenylobacterium sp. TaxID=1871053 RepID=UPI002DEBEA3A|nr:hypothetical protein [Phenylobacterium sp.]